MSHCEQDLEQNPCFEQNLCFEQNSCLFKEIDITIENLKIHVLMDKSFFHPDDSWEVHPHNHSFYEVHFLTEGKITLGYNGQNCILEKNDICLIPPLTYHGTGKVLSTAKKISIRFTFEQMQNISYDEDIFTYFNGLMNEIGWIKVIKGDEGCTDMLHQAVQEYRSGRRGAKANMRAMLAIIFIRFMRLSDGKEDKTKEDSPLDSRADDTPGIRNAKVEEFFESNYHKEIFLSDLEKHLFLGIRQTNRILSELYGMTFSQKLVDTRLNHAKIMLEKTNIPIEEIVALCGYQSKQGFYRAFKSHLGISPSDYRDEYLSDCSKC